MKKRKRGCKFGLFLAVILISLWFVGGVNAENFTDDFTDNSKINRTTRLIVNNTNKQAILQSDANTFSNNETLLLTHLGNDTDITNPEIALGGGGNPYIIQAEFNDTLHYDYNSAMIGWWNFTIDTNDSSGNGNNGTVTGATHVGEHYEFNGSTDYIELSTSSNPRNITILAWINQTSGSSSTRAIINYGTTLLEINSKVILNFYPNVGEATIGKGYTFNADTWYHVAITYNYDYNSTNGQYFLYVNGVQQHTAFGTNESGSGSGKYIGNFNSNSRWFNGSIDEIAIYNRTLNSTEILEEYQNTAPSKNISTVGYTTGNGGIIGEALIINSTSNVTFPASGNFDPKKGTIDFGLKKSNWSRYSDEIIFYTTDGDKTIQILRNVNSRLDMRFYNGSDFIASRSIDTSGFEANSWHNFTFSWNIEEDSYYIAVWVDGVFNENQELADPVPNNISVSSIFDSFDFETLYIGRRPTSGSWHLNGTIDELRITNTEFSNNNYHSKPSILISEAFDTGISAPIWGNITWDESLPLKTDIEFQTSVSDDGVTWSNWFSSEQADKGMITLTFDDGRDDIYTNATPIMDNFSFSGVFYIVPNWVGTAGYCNISQLQELQNDYGWEIGSHTMNHINKPNVSELNDSKQWLINNNLGYSSLGYPYGGFDQATINITSDYYTTARTIISSQYMTYDNKYRLYIYDGATWDTSLAEIIDTVAANKAWQILTFHSVGATGKSANIGIDDFNSFLSYINDSGVDVVTMAQALDRLGMYTNNTGEQIASQNKRYIRYRALLWSYDGISAPNLSTVTIYYTSVNATDFDGSTTNFFTANSSNITNLVLEKSSYGKINFSVSVNLSGGANLNTYIIISDNYIYINSTALSELNKSATLTLYNLTFTNPRILKDGAVCPSSICTEMSYTSDGNFTFTVTSFSAYSTEETPVTTTTTTTTAGGGARGIYPKVLTLNLTEKEQSIDVSRIDELYIFYNNKKYLIKIKKLTNEFVNLSIDSFFIALKTDESKIIDLDKDGINETKISFKIGFFGLYKSRAKLSFMGIKKIGKEKPIVEEEEIVKEEKLEEQSIITENETKPTPEPEQKPKNKKLIGGLIVLIIVVVGLTSFFFFKKSKKNKIYLP